MKQQFPQKQKKPVRPDTLIGLILIAVLLLSTVTLAYLYLQDRKQQELLLKQVQETQKKLDQIQVSLAQGDLKKAFSELAQAQKNVADLLPPVAGTEPKSVVAQKKPPAPIQPTTVPLPAAKPPAAAPAPVPPAPGTAPVKSTPAPIPTGLTLAADENPYPLIQADAGEYLLIAEKDQKTLHLFQYTDNRFMLVKSYPCIVGANGFDKKREGDLATPVGNYFSLRYIPGKSLPEKYGYGAFVLNYPNFLDRKARKDGTGIWLHGHTPGKSLGDPELQNTKGCIAVNNDVLKELTRFLKASGAPVVVVNRLQLTKTSTQRQLAEELNTFMKAWSKAWESGNSKTFMSHYSNDFINADGMNYQAFKQQKERVNSGKKFIRVQIENPAILLVPEEKGRIAVFRFTQRYRSSNFESNSRKIFYLKKGQAGWQIIGESRL
jgi:murein L,D-transpeptidase YafK